MTNLYQPRPFSTPYDTPEQRHAARYGTRRRHRHAAWISSRAKRDLQYIGVCLAFWVFILGSIVAFG